MLSFVKEQIIYITSCCTAFIVQAIIMITQWEEYKQLLPAVDILVYVCFFVEFTTIALAFWKFAFKNWVLSRQMPVYFYEMKILTTEIHVYGKSLNENDYNRIENIATINIILTNIVIEVLAYLVQFEEYYLKCRDVLTVFLCWG